MQNHSSMHSFHIPVMGIGFTIDTPAKIAQYGISSVISIVDDMLIEKLREFYCEKVNIPFQAISDKIEDFRAKRITAYLNLIDDIVNEKFEKLLRSASEKGLEFEKYINMLPSTSEIKKSYNIISQNLSLKELQEWAAQNLVPGSIDVNIMTKLDKENYKNNELLPIEYNDAHAALRGFAKSKLSSSVVLSAGMSSRLYSYIENFDDFYPDQYGKLKKKIILKVSDYKSAFIQGKLFANKGLWVSEYRVESGLNCGGHAFPTNGLLMGPILEQFRLNFDKLIQTTSEVLKQALAKKERSFPNEALKTIVTAQGGVGTAEEHDFLMSYYGLDSVGWATPFMLVPEAVSVDKYTEKLLSDSTEEELYLSEISPLGISFNSIKGNTKDLEKQKQIDDGTPGNVCTKKYLVSSKDYSERAICTASRRYQKAKIKELKSEELSPEEYKKQYDKIVEKACICVGLGVSSLLVNNLDTNLEGEGVSVCPGPNLAYFSEIVSLEKMVGHVYGRNNLIKRDDRPHVFVKELQMYIDLHKKRIAEEPKPIAQKQMQSFLSYQKNLKEGIEYYMDLFSSSNIIPDSVSTSVLKELKVLQGDLELSELHSESIR